MSEYSAPPVKVPLVYQSPLGLPPGSIRALLALTVTALFWLLLLLPPDKDVVIPLYLYFLLGLVLIFFASHGSSIGTEGSPPPWWLPRGTFRWVMVLGTLCVVAWAAHQNRDLLLSRLTPPAEQLPQWPFLLMFMAGGFILGWVIRLGPWRRAFWFQNLQAWVALIAMLLLGAEIVGRVLVAPNILQQPDLRFWERLLVAIVSFYFGVRCR